MEIDERSNTVFARDFRRLSGWSCYSSRQRTPEEDNCDCHGAKVSTIISHCSIVSPWGTGVSQPGFLLSSQCMTSLTQSSHFEDINSQLWPRENREFICALSSAGFHHNVCGQLRDSWFRPFSQPQKPLKGLWISISCCHVHYCGEVGDAIPLQMFFSAVAFINHMEDCKSHRTSRL